MEQLLQQAQIKNDKLRGLLHNISATELSKLSEPCYFPEHKAFYYELINACGLSEDQIKDFSKRFWEGKPQETWKLHSDPITMFAVFLLWYFLKEKDLQAYKSTMVYHVIRNYSNVIRKFMPSFCNPSVFKYTLDHMTKTHLFSREKTIGNALYHLSSEMIKKYSDSIKTGDTDLISKFIQECRHRINQSCRSFAAAYYKFSEAGSGYTSPYEDEEGREEVGAAALEKTERLSYDVAQKICVYRSKDIKAFEDARTLSKTSTSLATLIIEELGRPVYTQKVKFCLELFIKELTSMSEICGKNFYTFVRGLMGIKRTNRPVYFKSEINILLIEILKEIKYEKKFRGLTSQTQFLISLFLAYYLTIYLRNLLCGKKS